jgi:hypothetical protein
MAVATTYPSWSLKWQPEASDSGGSASGPGYSRAVRGQGSVFTPRVAECTLNGGNRENGHSPGCRKCNPLLDSQGQVWSAAGGPIRDALLYIHT